MQLNHGVLFSLLSSLALAVMGLLVSIGANQMHPAEILFFRSAVTVVLLAAFVFNEFKSFTRVNLKWFGLRAVCGGGAVLIYFFNLRALGPSLAISIASTSVIFSAFIGLVFNKEKITDMQIVGIVLCNLSLYMFYSSMKLIAFPQLLLGLVGAILTALSYQFMKKAAETNLSPNAVYFAYALASLFSSALLIDHTWSVPPLSFYPILVGVVAASWIGQIFLNLAYLQLGNVKASALGRFILVWAFILEFIFTSRAISVPQILLYLGIVLGAFLISFDQKPLERSL